MRKRKIYKSEKDLPSYAIYSLPGDKYEIPPALIFYDEKTIDIDGVKKDYYTINKLGEVYNTKGKLIKPSLINSGYYVYKLYTGNKYHHKYKNVLAHRLMKQIYDPIENMDNYTVNHIDMDRSNNCYDNLEWKTQAENNEEKYKINKSGIGCNNYQAHYNYEQLKIIVNMLDNAYSYKDILKAINVPDDRRERDYIGNIKLGKTYKYEVEKIRNNNKGSTTIP